MLALGTELVVGTIVLLLQLAEICRGAALPAAPWGTHKYRWACRSTGAEHVLNYATAGCGEPVLLLHGFGGNLGYWRETIPALASRGYKVYALDLLGFGGSDKPTDAPYSVELWAELALDFMDEHVQAPAVLVGNSLGSLVALSAAASRGEACARAGAAPPAASVAGLVLLNCAGGMNSKFVLADGGTPGWQRALLRPFFSLIDAVLTSPQLRDAAFRSYASEANVRSILRAVYTDKARVDDELVAAILAPAADAAAPEVFSAILTGEPGVQPSALLPRVNAPILAIWGDADSFTPLDGPTGKLFSRLAEERPGRAALRVVEAGHVPHDDNPAAVLAAALPFLREHLPACSDRGAAAPSQR